MKFIAAIFCSVMLMATPFLASAAAPCVKSPRPCCTHGQVMPCCAAKNNSAPQNAPAVPSPNSAQQNQISLPALTAVICLLPEIPSSTISSTTVSPSFAVAAPLFARNCSFLI